MTPEEKLKRRRESATRWYHRNKESVRVKGAARIGPRFEWLRKFKEATPCKDCGGKFPGECMDFDHLPGTKKFHPVAHLLHYKDFSVVEAEMSKCELVCANCHRIRTFARRRAKKILAVPVKARDG